MIHEGRMTEVGMTRIIEARERGEWSSVRVVSKKLVVPSFIQKALAKNEEVRAFFGILADSYRRQIVSWVSSAKKEETKARRLTEVISLLEKNQKLVLK
jgi:uncharacterized protein YdeI (YjbR/CyaY-like superfamily)